MRPRSADRLAVTTAFSAALVVLSILFAAFAPAMSAFAAGRSKAKASVEETQDMTLERFLDRLMQAESGGRAFAKSSSSTALGPFQFIASTWLQVVRKSFAEETAPLRIDQILELRTDRTFSRRAAEVYTEQNAAFLVAQGHKATFPNLRLAHLVGPGAAARILAARPETPAVSLLGATVIGANPFMAGMSASDLINRCARDITADPGSDAGITPAPELVLKAKADGSLTLSENRKKKARPQIAVRCDLSRPSCRKWLVLAERRQKKQRRASN